MGTVRPSTATSPVATRGPGRGLGDGAMLFDWYFDGDTPSEVFDGFRLSAPSARFFDTIAGRVGAIVAGRNTYDDSNGFGGASPHPTAPLFVVSPPAGTARGRRAADLLLLARGRDHRCPGGRRRQGRGH